MAATRKLNLLIPALFITLLLACGAMAGNDGQPHTGEALELGRQTESILAGFERTAEAIDRDNESAALEYLDALVASIKALQDKANSHEEAEVGQTARPSRGQVMPGPDGQVRPSGEPPTDEEIEAMKRATADTYQPGPPLRDVTVKNDTATPTARIESSCGEALNWLDQARRALQQHKLDKASIANANARDVIQELHESTGS